MNDEQSVCKICRRQVSKYTCPRCNIPYCSLTCFRASAHSDCSEGFYRKEIESGIRNEPSKSAAERVKMMELLKRFEEDSLDNDLFSDEDEQVSELPKRFKGVDVDSMTADHMWQMLSAEERTRFIAAMDNPASELAQELLASERIQDARVRPWWEVDPNAKRPQVFSVPLISSARSGQPLLIYNIVAVCIAYVYTIRTLGVFALGTIAKDDDDRHEARRQMSQLVPFMNDKNSSTLHKSLTAVTVDLWSRFERDGMKSETLTVLLKDAALLMRPSPVAVISQTKHLDSHPLNMLLRVLSDLVTLFTANSHQTRKLLFYASHAMETDPESFRLVSEELVSRSVVPDEDDGALVDPIIMPQKPALIEELVP